MQLSNQVNSLYSKECACCEGHHTLAYTKIYDILDNIKRIAKTMWNRDKPQGNKAFDLDHDVMEKEYSTLLKGIKEGLGVPDAIPGLGISYSDTRMDTIHRLRTNLVTFVAFKNYNQRAAMIKELLDEKGNIRSWNTYKSKVSLLSQEYNENWLRAEYNATVASTQSAVQWNTFQKQKNVFPYLKYRTQGDNKVRDSHAKLNGIVKHIDDAFWDDKYPPNGWNCRCFVLQDRGPGSDDNPTLDSKVHPPVFRFNTGKEKVIFDSTHPYFNINKKDKIEVLKSRDEFYFKNKIFYQQYENIEIHDSNFFTSSFNKDVDAIRRVSKILATQKSKMLPVEDTGYLAPDFLFDNSIVAEFKSSINHNIDTPLKNKIKNIRDAVINKKNSNRRAGAIEQLNQSRYNNLDKKIVLEIDLDLDGRNELVRQIFNSSRMHDIELILLFEGGYSRHKKG